MARSHSIYIIRGPHHDVLAAFTVKHEAKTFLDKRLCYKYLSVLRMPDGSESAGKHMTATEFMAAR